MKKALPIILLLLVATWAGATYLVSDQVEKNYQTAVNEANRQLASNFPFLSIKPVSFHQGFLRSEATSQLTGIDGSDSGITLKHQIHHGPIMFTADGVKTGSSYIVTTIDLQSLPDEAQKTISKMTDSSEPMVISLLTGASKMFDIDISLVPLNVKSSGKGEPDIAFNGFKGALHTDVDGSFLKGELTSGKLTLDDPKSHGQVVVAPATIDFDITDMYKGTALSGVIKTSVPAVAIRSPEFTTALRDLAMTSKSQSKAGKSSGQVIIDIAALQAKGKASRVELPESKVHFATRFDGIDTHALKHLLDAQDKINTLQMKTLSQTIKNGEPAELDGQVLAASISDFVKSAIELVKPGLQSKTGFQLSNKHGHAEVDLNLAYADSRDLSKLKTIRELVAAIKGQLDIAADSKLLSALSLDKLAAMPVKMGMAVQENGKIRSLITLENGKITVNGAPVPLLEMLGPILDQPSPIPAMVAMH